MPDTLEIERALEGVVPDVQMLGNQVRLVGAQGDAHSILIKDGKKDAGVDHRTRGAAAGY